MKESDLWRGHLYALPDYRSKGVFPRRCRKVKVLQTYQKRLPYNERMSTFAKVKVLTDYQHNPIEPYITEVKARDIYDHWDDWYREYSAEQRKVQAAEEARKQVEQGNIEYIRRIKQKLVDLGIPEHAILGDRSYALSIRGDVVARHFGIVHPKDEVATEPAQPEKEFDIYVPNKLKPYIGTRDPEDVAIERLSPRIG